MKNEKISVVLIVYNGQKTLMPCIKSILNQTYRNFELIIVDNNSTDKTKEIIENFQERDKRVKYVFEPKRGRGSARNAGIRKAKGSIIAMTDADCIVPENWLEQITELIRNGEEDVVMGFEKDLIGNYWAMNIQKRSFEFFNKDLIEKYTKNLDTKNFAVKTNVMKKFWFDEHLMTLEDYELSIRLRTLLPIRFMPKITVYHSHRNTASKLMKMQFERGYCLYQIYRKYKDKSIFQCEEMFQSAHLKNNMLFLPWLMLQSLKNPKEMPFLIFFEMSWRVGVLYGRLFK